MGDRREYLQRASKACNTPNLFPSPPQGGPFSGRQKQHFSAYYIIKFKLIMTIKMMIAMMIMVIILIRVGCPEQSLKKYKMELSVLGATWVRCLHPYIEPKSQLAPKSDKV